MPLFCWVVVHDAKALVTFDNAEMVGRRIEAAEALFGLSPAQARLARLIVDGKDLTEASGIVGISVTTARTHLQRIFERTGVHNQTAVVRVLLSAEAPDD
jgi:DNA-binding CsgD family transcriptional regulator